MIHHARYYIMLKRSQKFLMFYLLLTFMSSTPGYCASQDQESLQESIQLLKPLHTPLGPPGPWDWRSFNDEPDQTFTDYLNSNPMTVTDQKNTIYIQMLGELTPEQQKILHITIEFLQCYFSIPVQQLPSISIQEIPEYAQRTHLVWNIHQILSTYILEEILIPNIPPDAVAYIILTPYDLWPGEGWNFVFGQASIEDRVGVFSLYRNGDPTKSQDDYMTYLRRTLKSASHELGHMFSMLHCTFYECNMCGRNSAKEADKYPLYLCPECAAKLSWATKTDLLTRYQNLRDFAIKYNLTAEADYYQQAIKALKSREQ